MFSFSSGDVALIHNFIIFVIFVIIFRLLFMINQFMKKYIFIII